MAIAEKIPVRRKPQPEPFDVVLTLTSDEAYTLAAILRRIGGSPTNSPRRQAKSINDALAKANVFERDAEADLIDERNSTIYFEDYPSI